MSSTPPRNSDLSPALVCKARSKLSNVGIKFLHRVGKSILAELLLLADGTLASFSNSAWRRASRSTRLIAFCLQFVELSSTRRLPRIAGSTHAGFVSFSRPGQFVLGVQLRRVDLRFSVSSYHNFYFVFVLKFSSQPISTSAFHSDSFSILSKSRAMYETAVMVCW